MTLRIGNKPLFKTFRLNTKGFTFIEVMVALVIISVGLVAIFKSYIVALDQMSYLTGRVYASTALDNQILDIERRLKVYRVLPFELNESQKIQIGHKTIVLHPQMRISAVSGLNDVFQLDLALQWQEGQNQKRIGRSAYLFDSAIPEAKEKE